MLRWLADLWERLWAAYRRLPVAASVLVAVLVAGGFLGAAVFGYRTWDYVENDNEFCMGCHLMAEPFELFGESAHRDMGCKACHHPTLIERSKMGLAQFIRNPDSITVHAEVENEACADCHVFGAPEQWTLIAASAGHRVHFESEDPDLEGLMCVECHSTSVHQFTSTDATCRECHEDADVQMAGMDNLSINCGACHAFNAPLAGLEGTGVTAEGEVEPAPPGALEGVLSPTDTECLSCHVMRVQVEIPEEDPHERSCGFCHNPHTQASKDDAVQTCATADCHDEPGEEISPFHAGLSAEALAACTDCHNAHEFHAEGQDCLECHEDVFDDEGRRAGLTPPTVPGSATAGAGFHGMGAPPAPAGWMLTLAAHEPPATQDSTFRHAQHRDLECLECHTMETSHGEITVESLGGCRQCHHTPPESEDCVACHTGTTLEGLALASALTFELSVVDDPVSREVPFDHVSHEEAECSECHTDGLELSAGALDCTGCHEEHHTQQATCRTCHAAEPQDEHTVEAHVGCTGSGCHEEPAFQGVPRERELCLACHVEQVDHQVEAVESCADCHALPEAGAPTGVGL